ncbi:hypothetical protein JST97_24705 [bacterium]|nr:hypothetical protein [bacterium]
MDKSSLGMLLMAIGAVDLLLLSIIGIIKHKPVLLLAGIVGGVATGAVGLLIYQGKIL